MSPPEQALLALAEMDAAPGVQHLVADGPAVDRSVTDPSATGRLVSDHFRTHPAATNRQLTEPDLTPDRASSAAVASFRIGAVNVTVRSSVPGVLEDYRAMYAPWETGPAGDALEIGAAAERGRYTRLRRYVIRCGGEPRFLVRREEEILPHLEWGLNWLVTQRETRYLHLHAGVVEFAGQGWVFPGCPGSGKTTLTAGLLGRGWRYFSDELALIEPGTGRLQPYPRALCIKQPSFAVVERLGLHLFAPRPYQKGSKGRVAYIAPAHLDPRCLGEPCRIGFVVFPQYTAGAAPRLETITRGEAVFLLNQQAFNFDRFGAEGLGLLSRAIDSAQCFRLTAGELGATCDLLTGLGMRSSRA